MSNARNLTEREVSLHYTVYCTTVCVSMGHSISWQWRELRWKLIFSRTCCMVVLIAGEVIHTSGIFLDAARGVTLKTLMPAGRNSVDATWDVL